MGVLVSTRYYPGRSPKYNAAAFQPLELNARSSGAGRSTRPRSTGVLRIVRLFGSRRLFSRYMFLMYQQYIGPGRLVTSAFQNRRSKRSGDFPFR